jgi:hypothetical protein
VDPDTYLRVTALMTHRSQELPKRTIDTSDYRGQRRHIEGALPLRVRNIRSENDEIQIGPACRSLVDVLRPDCSTHVNCMISVAQLQIHLHSRVGHVLEETPLLHVKPVRLGEVKTEGVNAHPLLGDALEDRESGQVLRAVFIVEVDDHAESVVLGVSEFLLKVILKFGSYLVAVPGLRHALVCVDGVDVRVGYSVVTSFWDLDASQVHLLD